MAKQQQRIHLSPLTFNSQNSFVTNSTAKNEWIPWTEISGEFSCVNASNYHEMRTARVAKVAKYSWFPNWYSLNMYLCRLPPPSTKSCCFGIFSNAPLVTFHPGSWVHSFCRIPHIRNCWKRRTNHRGSGIHPLGFSWRRWTNIQHQPHKFTQNLRPFSFLGRAKIQKNKSRSQSFVFLIWVFPKIMVPPNHPILIGLSMK